MIEKLENLIKDDIKSLGLILWGIEIFNNNKNKFSTTRIIIYIDQKNGITIQECKKVNNTIKMILNVENIFSNGYVLEISSPGVNRRIFNLSQAKKMIENKVKIQLFNTINCSNRYRYQGILKKVINNDIIIETQLGKTINLNFNNINKISII